MKTDIFLSLDFFLIRRRKDNWISIPKIFSRFFTVVSLAQLPLHRTLGQEVSSENTRSLSLSFFFVGEVFINLIMNTKIFPQALTAVSPAHLQRARLECGRSRERILHLSFFFMEEEYINLRQEY